MQTYQRTIRANAFSSTFYFFADTQANVKKIKGACKPSHGDTVNLTRYDFGQTEARTDNIWFKKLTVQWLNELLFFASSVVLANSFELRNRQLLKPTKRSTSPPKSL